MRSKEEKKKKYVKSLSIQYETLLMDGAMRPQDSFYWEGFGSRRVNDRSCWA